MRVAMDGFLDAPVLHHILVALIALSAFGVALSAIAACIVCKTLR